MFSPGIAKYIILCIIILSLGGAEKFCIGNNLARQIVRYKNKNKAIVYTDISAVLILGLPSIPYTALCIAAQLLLCGDIHPNPGPTISYDECTQKVRSSKCLKYLLCNCRSVLRKRNLLNGMCNDLGSETIYGITETWLKPTDDQKLWSLLPESMVTFRNDRDLNYSSKKRGGGVLLAVPRVLNPIQRQDLNSNSGDFESQWVECHLDEKGKQKQLINLSYNPNKSLGEEFLEQLTSSIDKAIKENKTIVLMGDYNLDYLNEKDRGLLDSAIVPYGLTVSNKATPTRISRTSKKLLDYIITDDNLPVESHVFKPLLKTDHDGTIAISNIQCESRKNVIIKTIFCKKQYNQKQFSDTVNHSHWEHFYNQPCAEGMFTEFCMILMKALHQHAPKRKIFIRNDKPILTQNKKWYSKQSKTIRKQIELAYGSDQITNANILSTFLADRVIREEDVFDRNFFNDLQSDRKKWNFINELRNSRRMASVINTLHAAGKVITDHTEIANTLNEAFIKLGEYVGERITYLPIAEQPISSRFMFSYVTQQEVMKILSNLKTNKPSGPSDIPAWALKDAKEAVCEPLTFLINEFIKEERFPRHLKLANVTPIYKKGDPTSPINHRPISITGVLAKVFEKAMANQMTNYMKDNKLFSATQFGFRQNYSTQDALLYSIETFRKEGDDGKFTAGVLLDLSKAFDSMSHSILSQKLTKYGFSASAVRLIMCYLTDRHQRVITSQASSDWLPTNKGVPQGTILGPLLFNIYINDMKSVVPNNCKIVQYADDTFIFSSNKDIDMAIQNVEEACKNLVVYFKAHELMLNVDKTEFTIFCKKSKIKETELRKIDICEKSIRLQSEVKYLGIIIDQGLTFQPQVKTVLQKMACGIKCIYAIRNRFPLKTRLLLLNALVLSHFCYSAIYFTGLTQNLKCTLEKQLSWGVKACCYRSKFQESLDLKIKHRILPINCMINYRALLLFYRLYNNQQEAFQELNFPTYNISLNIRTEKLAFNAKVTPFLSTSVVRRGLCLFNELPYDTRAKYMNPKKAKHELKKCVIRTFLSDPRSNVFGKSSIGDMRFR